MRGRGWRSRTDACELDKIIEKFNVFPMEELSPAADTSTFDERIAGIERRSNWQRIQSLRERIPGMPIDQLVILYAYTDRELFHMPHDDAIDAAIMVFLEKIQELIIQEADRRRCSR